MCVGEIWHRRFLVLDGNFLILVECVAYYQNKYVAFRIRFGRCWHSVVMAIEAYTITSTGNNITDGSDGSGGCGDVLIGECARNRQNPVNRGNRTKIHSAK